MCYSEGVLESVGGHPSTNVVGDNKRFDKEMEGLVKDKVDLHDDILRRLERIDRMKKAAKAREAIESKVAADK